MVVVDPMDREILGTYVENQAIPVKELVDKVAMLKPVHGSQLSIPLSPCQYIKLKALFDHGFSIIARCGDEFLEQAKASKTFNQDFKKLKEVREFSEHVHFFAQH
jgi:hypothetical protein